MSLSYTCGPVAALQSLEGVLGGAAIGTNVQPTAAAPWPRQALRAPLLLAADGAPLHEEAWFAGGPAQEVQEGHSEGIHWRRTADVLYGVIELHEDDPALSAAPFAGLPPLQAASELLYRRLFRLLQAQALPQLWRVWNYLARINESSHGLERYRQFNFGRHQALLAAQRDTGRQLPAACAIGVEDGPLSVAFLAGRTPLRPLENPRQVSAWQYPTQYGPRAPSFSRAALADVGHTEALFVSGTASIVGHETVHLGDVAAQCEETVRNIQCLVEQANRQARSAQPFSLAGLSHRAYVRHAEHARTVHDTLQPLLGGAPLVCVLSDICRADLLVEVESQALHPMASA
ncbi:chorismate transformation enzyme, FkbO/Hyg5 family [Hydrogenophaga palleronii]|uniref:chorismate transformation enzyme, FkbO/Hyg5 family n=1 Tax=Hydrogenophaga palleronii TaxID=65655 RepID=UPI000826AF5A|nr:hypothetical protein [Hydrogenophaga palleronii]